ncbi:MAG TPA: invasin domain 3-containing protein, partial [Thermoanaerobaculia bacterium]|nr:invasin domain 3-containing protein [Thermoanaerobaculia bacterium]
MLLAPRGAAQGIYAEGGYANKRSVAAGDVIGFHIATATRPFTVQVVNMATPDTVLTTLTGLTSQARDCTGMWETGCNWPVTTNFTVPSTWTPGFYAARFPTTRGTRHILFVVRAPVPGSYAPIAVIQTSHTDTAYNRFGGKSVYDNLSSNNQRAHIVSFNRPYWDDAGLTRFASWEQPFVFWMKQENRRFEVITDEDMEARIPLSGYKALIIVGHSEYWSLHARQHLDAFLQSGGHLAIFGGNTMWWQVRVDLATRQMTVYKKASLDPLTASNPDVSTVNWYDWPVFNPENTTIGASFRHAGYNNMTANFERIPLDQRVPFTVTNPTSWVYAGTGVTMGQEFGRSGAGIEVDGVTFNTLPNGSVVVEGSDGTPLSTDILATIPASEGYGTISVTTLPEGGTIFNGSSRDWAIGLASDAVIAQITRNVLDRFATGQPFAHQPRITANRVEDLFNTPSPVEGVLPGWFYRLFEMRLSQRCAHEGPTGLELTGTQWTQLWRSFAVDQTGISSAATSIRLNADFLEQTPEWPFPIVELVNFQGPEQQYVAALEIQKFPDGRKVRLSAFRSNGVYSASTAWITLETGWELVRMTWRSPGTIELDVSGRKATAANPDSGQTVNGLLLEFAGTDFQAVGSVCVDELQLRDSWASPAHSTITASPTSVPANGTTASTITVRLKDAAGNNITTGGDSVTLSTTRGTLSSVTDLGDGRYRATLTSTTTGTATVRGTVNGANINSSATVTFTAQAASLLLTAPANVVAGEPFSITVTARDSAGNPTSTYLGTVRFTSNATAATLPPNYTFQPSDNGTHTFTAVVLRNIGARTITVTDTSNASLTSTANVRVQGTTTTTLTSSANPARAGVAITLTATVSTTATGGTMSGSVTFRDGSAVLGTSTLSGNTATFSTSSLAPGSHSLTATYGGNADFLTSTSAALAQTIIGPASGATSQITASPASIPANGTSTSTITVRVKDASGTDIPSGGDTVALTTTSGTLSSVADRGNGTYEATLTSSTSSGTATIRGTVNGAAITDTATVTFTTQVTSLALTAPPSVVAGEPFSITVTARDAAGNPTPAYTGTVRFTSSSTSSTLPANATFTSADNGTRTFSGVILRNVGTRTITVTDTSNAALTSTANVRVTGATTTTLASSRNPSPSGASITLTATIATTAIGGTIAGNVSFHDGSTLLGTSAVASGTATLTTSSLAPGTHALTATYNGSEDFSGSTSAPLSQTIIGPASGATSEITAAPASIPANGTSQSLITVRLRDSAGRNLITGGDSVTLSTTAGTLGSVVDRGNGTYEATLTSSTTATTATIRGTVNGASIASTATVTFTTQATSMTLTAPADAVAGEPFSITVTVRDAAGHPTSAYSGTVQFTSTASSATLPADYTFVPSDNGVRTFTGVVVRNPGAHTITVTDGSLTGSANVRV